MACCYINCGRIAHRSELQFFKAASDKLPDGWVVIGNPMLFGGRSSREFDAIIIAPGRVWAIELKAWRGVIRADQEEWQQEGRPPQTSPLKLLAQKYRQFLISPSQKMGGNIRVGGLVVMMKGSPGDLHLTAGRENVVYFKDIIPRLLSESKGMSLPERSKIRAFIHEVISERAALSYDAGGDIVPDKPDAIGTNIAFILSDEKGMEHVWYSAEFERIVLNRDEMRGFTPSNWKNWHNEGIWLKFTPEGPEIEPIPGIDVSIEGTVVRPGFPMLLNIRKGKIVIDGMPLNYSIEKDI